MSGRLLRLAEAWLDTHDSLSGGHCRSRLAVSQVWQELVRLFRWRSVPALSGVRMPPHAPYGVCGGGSWNPGLVDEAMVD